MVSLNVEKEIIQFLTDFFLEYEKTPPNSFIMINAAMIVKADPTVPEKTINTVECKSGIFAVKILNENSIKIK